jgi:AraC-like DNA-binding protein
MMAFLHNLKSVFHALIIFQCLVFSVYLLSARARKTGNTLLALFLIAVGLNELGGIFLHFLDLRKLIIASVPHLLYLNIPLSFLAAPLLYLFIQSVVNNGFRMSPAHGLHLIPFVVYAFLTVARFQAHSPETMRRIVEAGGPFSRPESLAFNLVFFAQWLAYGAACFILLRKYRASLKDYYSNMEPWSLSWLGSLLATVLLTRTLDAIEFGLWYATGDTRVVILYYAAQVLFLVFLTLLFFRAINIVPSFQGVVESLPPKKAKYEKTLLPDAQKLEYARKLASYMEAERPYLDPLLSLGDLAKKISVPGHYLSQVLNSHFGMNFFDFVNSYRIRESQKLLLETNSGRRTILDVLYEAGFNSKSVFNTAFKKHTRMTPSEYKKSLRAAARNIA